MKKYRTKSGKVEEKLPGINATVSPSEKAQIAMAGGADTLKDVQTILGQEGKRNNLKGQGAKHLISFQGFSEGPEGYGPSDSGFAPDDIGDTYSPPAVPDFGKYGEPGGIARPDPDFGKYGEPGGTEDDVPGRHKQSNLRDPAKRGGAFMEYPPDQAWPTYRKAGNETYFQDEDFWEDKEQTDWEKANPDPSILDKVERGYDKYTSYYNIDNRMMMAGANLALSAATVNPVGMVMSAAELAYLSSRKSTAKEDKTPMPGLTSKAAEEYADLYTSPPPDDPYSGGDDAPKKKKKKKKLTPSSDNRVTLDVKSPTRTQKRYRGGWRTV